MKWKIEIDFESKDLPEGMAQSMAECAKLSAEIAVLDVAGQHIKSISASVVSVETTDEGKDA